MWTNTRYNARPHNANQIIIMKIKVYKILQKKIEK